MQDKYVNMQAIYVNMQLIYPPKIVTHNMLVYRQVQIIVAATCVFVCKLCHRVQRIEFWGFLVDFMLLKRKKS